jgi:dephospho-CoA kinase
MASPSDFLVVGLTGGIGSGKTTVADCFARVGVAVIDTDAIAHALTAPGAAAIAPILAAFGDSVIAESGALDRHAMRERAFADPHARAQLEGILHPMIRSASRDALRQAQQSGAPYAVWVVPLLFEAERLDYRAVAARTLLVDCPVMQQVVRVEKRSGLSRLQIEKIMATQVPRAIRLQLADDVICNVGSTDVLMAEVGALHDRYATLASHGN